MTLDFAEVLIRHLMTESKFDFPTIITTRDGPAKSLTVLEISGVNGIRTSKLNVLYVLVDDIHNDKPLFKKEGDAEGRLMLRKGVSPTVNAKMPTTTGVIVGARRVSTTQYWLYSDKCWTKTWSIKSFLR